MAISILDFVQTLLEASAHERHCIVVRELPPAALVTADAQAWPRLSQALVAASLRRQAHADHANAGGEAFAALKRGDLVCRAGRTRVVPRRAVVSPR